MFDRFTDRARKTLGLARGEAQRLSHDYIGTEHMLLGLIAEGSGVGMTALKNLGMSLDDIRPRVGALVGPRLDVITTGQLPFTPGGKRVLECSLEQAQALGHGYIGTEHLVLGLIAEGKGVAAQVLAGLSIQLSDVQQAVVDILGSDGAPRERPEGVRSQGAAQETAADDVGRRLDTMEQLVRRLAAEIRALRSELQ